MKGRIICDIDYTLLIPNYQKEIYFIPKYLPGINSYFIHHMGEILAAYETKYPRYDIQLLLEHLNQYSSVLIKESFIYAWFRFNEDIDEQDVTETKQALEYLSGYERVVLSNWFKKNQVEKLKKAGLLSYFKEIYAGDEFLKPYPESYTNACGRFPIEDCIMIGDSLEADVIGAQSVGLSAIHVTGEKTFEHDFPKVKKFADIKRLFKEE